MKRSGSPLASSSSLPPPPPAKKLASLFNKPVASGSVASASGSTMHKAPRLGITGLPGGAFQGVWGDWKSSKKIAAFDVDGTIIKPRKNAKWPRDEHDWEFWNGRVATKLRRAHSDGHSIVFISNQAGTPKTQQAFERKLAHIGRELGVPFRAYAAYGYDEFRKPSHGIWLRFVQDFNDGLEIDYEHSFYCGDAAGRPSDHSDSDRKMAINAGLSFCTPEEYFNDLSPSSAASQFALSAKTWDARAYNHDIPFFSPTSLRLVPRKGSPAEVVILVGPPAAGKTHLYETYFRSAGYVLITPDLTSRQTCLQQLSAALSLPTPQSIMIDARNPTKVSRSHYISLVQASFPDTPIRAFYFKAKCEVCQHNSIYRALYGAGGGGSVPGQDFLTYKAGLIVPSVEEGFTEVKTINFKFEGTEVEKQNWEKWLDSYRKAK